MPVRWIIRILLVLSVVASAFAQTQSGSVVGTITDPQGALVGGAGVSLISSTTGAVRFMTSDERGSFAFNAVAADTYMLQVELAGFKKYEKTNIHLEPNGHLSLGEIRLSLGGVNEQVMVVAEGTAVQTVSSERSGVV